MQTSKILLFVPDGTGIKNYLYSRTFQQKEVEIILFHNFDAATLSEIKKHIIIASEIEIPSYTESIPEKFLREVIHLARIKHNAAIAKNKTIHKFYRSNQKSAKLKLFYKAVELRARLVTSYASILRLEKAYQKRLRKNPLYEVTQQLLKEHQPDSLFCTHQRALKAPVIFAAAREAKIATTTVIYSWDNIPKARLALKADTYFVWSEYMKNELQLFYPEIPIACIKVTGTPQFEFYKDKKNVLPKEEFYTSCGLDSSKKIICFSGDDVHTSPHDPQYLNDMATAISESGLDKQLQIVFRRCPVDVSGRYDWVLKKFPDLIVAMPPLWNFNSEIWSAVYPTFADVKLLVSLAYYADVVVNVGSTMAFDFGMFAKPCIFINYDTVNNPNWSVDTIYKYQHFRSMPTKEAVYWFNAKAEIATVITKVLDTPNTAIDTWFLVVVEDALKASKNILNELS